MSNPAEVKILNATHDVMGYQELTQIVSRELKNSGFDISARKVRDVLEAVQAVTVKHLAQHAGNRVRFGRLCAFISRMTSDRMVTNPQKPGEQVHSFSHIILRVAAGSKAEIALNGGGWLADDPTEPTEAELVKES